MNMPTVQTMVSDNRYYFGSMSHSIERLPQWYQAFAICAVFFLIYLRHSPVMKWLVVKLHHSFGTERIWSQEYQNLLEGMSFNERLCFTLYGVVLTAVVSLMHTIFFRDSISGGWLDKVLMPDKRWATVCMVVLMFASATLELKEIIAKCQQDEESPSFSALRSFALSVETSNTARATTTNVHIAFQLEVLQYSIAVFCLKFIPSACLAVAYRACRDVPRKSHVSLRWYMLTLMSMRVLMEGASMYIRRDWWDAGSWGVVCWTAIFLGTVNYIYGPYERAGVVVTLSTAMSFRMALIGLGLSCVMWSIVFLCVLTAVVSVHVVELLLLWLTMTLLIVWIPAIVDSCSTDYIAMLVGASTYLCYAVRNLSALGSARFYALVCLWWLNVCLVYNAVVNFTRQRYMGIGVLVLLITLLLISSDGRAADTSNAESGQKKMSSKFLDVSDAATVWVLWLCDVAELRVPEIGWLATRSYATGKTPYALAMQLGVLVMVLLVAVISIIGNLQSSDVKARLRRRNVVLVTPGVLFRKSMRTVVHLVCAASFLSSGYVFQHCLLPHTTELLPDIVFKCISGVVACTVLGSMMDVRETLYETIMRVAGFHYPGEHGSAVETVDHSDENDLSLSR